MKKLCTQVIQEIKDDRTNRFKKECTLEELKGVFFNEYDLLKGIIIVSNIEKFEEAKNEKQKKCEEEDAAGTGTHSKEIVYSNIGYGRLQPCNLYTRK